MRKGALWRALRRDFFMQGVIVVGVGLILLVILGPLLVPAPASEIITRLQPPSWLGGDGGLLGTDELGRSVAIRIMYGLRTSYLIGLLAVLLGAAIGITVGLTAGYVGGRLETVLMTIVDIQLSLPGLLLAMALTVMTGGGVPILVIALGLTSWTLYARIGRAAVLRLRQTDFIQATQAMGAGTGRVIAAHLLPNVLGSFVTVATLEFARLMLAEATLSFLGFGVQAPGISLGRIMSGGQDYLVTQPWVTGFAGAALAIGVLTFNIFGSWFERVSNPTADLGRDGITDSGNILKGRAA